MNTFQDKLLQNTKQSLYSTGIQMWDSICKTAVQFICVFGIVIATGLVPAIARAETNGTQVGGPIFGNVTWTAANSPYTVNSNVQVMQDATLTIEPGVTVRFATAKALVVNGQLLARGTAGNPILFTRDTPVVTNWGYIKFEASSTDATFDTNGVYTGGSILQNATIEFAGGVDNNPAAIVVSASSPYFDHITVHDSARVGIALSNSSTRIANSTITANNGDGITLNNSAGRITQTSIEKNKGNGISTSSGSLSESSLIAENTIEKNGGSGIVLGYSGWSNGVVEKNIIRNNSGYGVNCGRTLLRDNQIYRNGGTGIYAYFCDVTRNIVAYNSNGGIYSNYGNLTHNKVAGNVTQTASGFAGIGQDGNGSVTNNSVVFNQVKSVAMGFVMAGCRSGYGEFSYNTIIGQTVVDTNHTGGIVLGDGTITCPFHHNNIHDNQGYDLYNGNSQTSGTLNARFNYWGTTDSNLIHPEMYDFIDDASKASTNYSDFLLEPDITAPPAPPTGLQVSVNNGVFTLKWDANRESDIAGYRVYYDVDSGYPYEGTGAIQGASGIDVGNATTYNLSGLPANTDIYFTVLAYDNSDNAWDGTSWYALEKIGNTDVTITPDPTVPTVTVTPTTPAPITPVPTITVTITPTISPTTVLTTPTALPTTPAPITPVPTTPVPLPTTPTPIKPTPATPTPVTLTSTPVPIDKADLFGYADELSVNPSVPHVGDNTQLALTVHMRNGRSVAQNVKVAFYLGTQETLLGTGKVPFIDPPNKSELTLPLNISLPTAGTVTLIAVIDPDNQIDEGEAGEQNNVITQTVTIAPASADKTVPVVTKILLENGTDTTKTQTVNAQIEAADPQPNSSGVSSVCLVEYTYNTKDLRWEPVKMSDWLSYADPALHTNWQLHPKPGMHYIQVRGLDNAQNISIGNARAQISYIPESDTVAKGETRVYRQEVAVGQKLEVTVEPISGDPDLYVWSSQIDQSAWVSNQEGSAVEVVRIPTSQIAPGVYQFEVYGFNDAQYRLQINVTDGNSVQSAQQSAVSGGLSNKSIPSHPVVPVASTPSEGGPIPSLPSTGAKVFLPFVVR